MRRVKDSWKIVVERWRRAIEALPDHDLILFYSPFPDFAHHVLHRGDELVYVKNYYTIQQNLPFLGELKNVAVLIVSDHGFIQEEYTHSDHGFWSSSVDLTSKPKTILDFHDIILNLVRQERLNPRAGE